MSDSSANKVPFGQKLAFGFGMLANQLFPAALGVFFVLLIDGGGFSPLLWGLLAFAPRIFDAITDPLMGFVSDNTRSKWGRRRQYVFVGALMLGISYIFMWQLYGANGQAFNFWYFLGWSLVFYLGLTIFSVPYVAMGYEMSDDFHERTSIMAVGQFVGQWAWVLAPWLWVLVAHPMLFPNTTEQAFGLVDQMNNYAIEVVETAPELATSFKESADALQLSSQNLVDEETIGPRGGDAELGVRVLAIWVAIPCTIFALIPAIFIRSKSTLDRNDLQPISMSTLGNSLADVFISTVEAFKIPQFRKLAIATFLVFNTFEIIASFTFLIIVHHLFNSDQGAAGIWPAMHGCIGALITTFLVIPLVAYISKIIGKKKAFLLSQAISIVGYILFWFLFIPGQPYLFLIALPFHSFGIGGLFTLMMSMTADVCDIDELNTGKRREGILGAVYWWMVKFGKAFAGLATGVILWFVGFAGADSSESAIVGIRLFYTLLPVTGVVLAILVMWNYDITEEKAEEVRTQLQKKKRDIKSLEDG